MDPQLSPHQGGAVSQPVVDALVRTRGWVLFISVLLWLGVAGMLMGGVAMIGIGLLGGTMADQVSAEMGEAMGAEGGWVVAAMGVFYLVLAVFYIYPALKLGKYASCISSLRATPSQSNLAAALEQQRGFWKFFGVLMILFIALYFVIIFVAVIAGVIGGAAAASGGIG